MPLPSAMTASGALACLIALALSAIGCAPVDGLLLDDPSRKAYVAPVLEVPGDAPALLGAVESYVSSMGWSIDLVDPAGARVVAHTDTRDAYTLQRDTWTFDVQRGRVAVRRLTALGDTNGTNLVTSDAVCGSYSYALESDHLARIAALVPRQRATGRVAVR